MADQTHEPGPEKAAGPAGARGAATWRVLIYVLVTAVICAVTYLAAYRSLTRLGHPDPGGAARFFAALLACASLLVGAALVAISLNAPTKKDRNGVACDAIVLVMLEVTLAAAYHVMGAMRAAGPRTAVGWLLLAVLPAAAIGLCVAVRVRRGWRWLGADRRRVALALFLAVLSGAWCWFALGSAASVPRPSVFDLFITAMVLLNLLFLIAYSLRLVAVFRAEFDAQCTRP
jgi:hypothetical protein